MFSSSLAASLILSGVQGGSQTNSTVASLTPSIALMRVSTSPGKLPATGQAGVVRYPARVKCATLAWHTFNAALANKIETVSTE